MPQRPRLESLLILDGTPARGQRITDVLPPPLAARARFSVQGPARTRLYNLLQDKGRTSDDRLLRYVLLYADEPVRKDALVGMGLALVSQRGPSRGASSMGSPTDEPLHGEQIALHHPQAGLLLRDAWGLEGGRGQGIRVGVVDCAWSLNQPELDGVDVVELGTPPPSTARWAWAIEHGNMTAAVIASRVNAVAYTGVVPSLERLVMATTWSDAGPVETCDLVAEALIAIGAELRPGDVVVVPREWTNYETTYDGSPETLSGVPIDLAPDVRDACTSLQDDGVVLVGAAGNSGERAHGVLDLGKVGPADWYGEKTPRMILASACDPAGYVHRHGNHGAPVDAFALGSDVRCAIGGLYNASAVGGYSGTSAAATLIAGAIALLQGVAKAHGSPMEPDAVRSLLRSTHHARGTVEDVGYPWTLRSVGRIPNLDDIAAELAAGGNGLGEPPSVSSTVSDASTMPSPSSDEGCGGAISEVLTRLLDAVEEDDAEAVALAMKSLACS